VLPQGDIGKVVGRAFTIDGENRPTGEHTHAYQWQETTGQDKGVGAGKVAAGTNYDRYPESSRTGSPLVGSGESLAPGTNAPYVQLLACRKE
jgi:hypothetical protein